MSTIDVTISDNNPQYAAKVAVGIVPEVDQIPFDLLADLLELPPTQQWYAVYSGKLYGPAVYSDSEHGLILKIQDSTVPMAKLIEEQRVKVTFAGSEVWKNGVDCQIYFANAPTLSKAKDRYLLTVPVMLTTDSTSKTRSDFLAVVDDPQAAAEFVRRPSIISGLDYLDEVLDADNLPPGHEVSVTVVGFASYPKKEEYANYPGELYSTAVVQYLDKTYKVRVSGRLEPMIAGLKTEKISIPATVRKAKKRLNLYYLSPSVSDLK